MIPKLEIFLNNRSTTIHRLLHILFTYDALFNWTIVKICILYTMISRAQTHFIFCYQPKNNGTELQRRTKLSRNDLGFQLTYRAALKTWKALGSSVSQLEAEMLPVDWSSWQRSQLFNLHSEAKKEERSSISHQKKNQLKLKPVPGGPMIWKVSGPQASHSPPTPILPHRPSTSPHTFYSRLPHLMLLSVIFKPSFSLLLFSFTLFTFPNAFCWIFLL